jgi:CBS domain-containing protein
MSIREIMSVPVVTCRSTDNLTTAARLMWEHDCGAVPVLSDEGTVEGMITDRDVCMAAYTRGRPLHGILVSDAMSKQVFSCHPDDSISAAEQLMSYRQVRRVPIVDQSDHLMGLVSLNDIARYAAAAPKRNGIDREFTRTLAAVGRPRSQALTTRPLQARPQTTRQIVAPH